MLGLLLGWYGLEYVLYGAIAGHVLALLLAVGMSIHKRKLLVRYSFGPPLIAGTLASCSSTRRSIGSVVPTA